MTRAATTLALMFSLLPSLAAAGIRLVDYGVICEVILTNKRAAPNTESGVLNIIGPGRDFNVRTDRVPAELGLSFGLRIALPDGADGQTVKVTVRHPPMGAKRITRQRWTAPIAGGERILNLYTFENEHELVKGRWRFTIEGADGKTIRHTFHVSGPLDVPAVQDACYGGQITS